uniref:invasin domain 3-containing protein n=1 Tax=Pantoea sp. BAV 3049 TaxID=2654188 RepID=UPI00131C7848
VTVIAGDVDPAHSDFHIAHQTIRADGKDAALVSFRAKDTSGNAVSGIADKLAFSSSSAADVVSPITESSSHPGLYQASLTGSLAGEHVVTPQYNSAAVGSLTGHVTVIAGDVDPAHSDFHIAHQ